MTTIRSFTNEQVKLAVKSSKTMADTLRKLGPKPHGANYKTINKIIKEINIDKSHWLGIRHLLGTKRKFVPIIQTKDLLVKGYYRSTHKLKLRLIKESLLENKCYKCGILQWQGHILSLHLDHINGDSTDNRIENLQFLCPNCHSLTPTYCGRNIGYKTPKKFCKDCKKKILFNSTRCRSCESKQRTKIKWPNTKKLLKMVNKTSYLSVGKSLGVSGNAVKHRIITHMPKL